MPGAGAKPRAGGRQQPGPRYRAWFGRVSAAGFRTVGGGGGSVSVSMWRVLVLLKSILTRSAATGGTHTYKQETSVEIYKIW